MGRRRTGVNKVRDIIRYSHNNDLSERQIARALGISRTVVAKTLQAFRASGLADTEVEQIPDSVLMTNLEQGNVEEDGIRYKELATGPAEMVVELKKKGVTLQWLWERDIHEHPQGYQYSQYRLHFHRWRRSEEVSMHIEYKAGEAMLVDWAGNKLKVINGLTGQESGIGSIRGDSRSQRADLRGGAGEPGGAALDSRQRGSVQVLRGRYQRPHPR